MNKVFRPAENIKINKKNSYVKLSHPFRKGNTGQNSLSYTGPAIWNRIPESLKKTKNVNTFKHKMKHYYLNDLSNPNLWNVGGFYYVLAIIKNIFLFIEQIFLLFFFIFSPASLWLKYHNKNKATCLFFVSLILLLTSTFFVCWLFFVIVWLFNFFCTYLDLLFLWQDKI